MAIFASLHHRSFSALYLPTLSKQRRPTALSFKRKKEKRLHFDAQNLLFQPKHFLLPSFSFLSPVWIRCFFVFFSTFFPPRHLLLAEQVAEIQQVGKKERRQIVKTLIMCINDTELEPRKEETIEEDTNSWTLPLPSQLVTTHMENSPNSTLPFPLESISEDTTVIIDEESTVLPDFLPTLRSGEWSDIGRRPYMEDTHICISDLAKNFGYDALGNEVVSFYGVFDGHGGKAAANFVRDHLPRVIVEDADFPLELEKVVTRSFLKTDTAFEKSCSQESTLSSGTTALTAMIFGRSLLVANAGDCRAVLSRRGIAIEMSKDHRPCCISEKTRVESLGGYIEDGYLNGQLGVTRALGDWHLDGLKQTGPLCADPELKLITLNKEDEFLIIGSDGIWDVFSSQNAIDFARRRLQAHNDVKLCCKEVVEEAIRRRGTDNLTAVMVCFNLEPPPGTVVQKTQFRRTISAEGLQSIMSSLDG